MAKTSIILLPPGTTAHVTAAAITTRLLATFPELGFSASTPFNLTHSLYRSPYTLFPSVEGGNGPLAYLHVFTLSSQTSSTFLHTVTPAHGPANEKDRSANVTSTVSLSNHDGGRAVERLVKGRMGALWSPVGGGTRVDGRWWDVGVCEIGIAEIRGGSIAGTSVVLVKTDLSQGDDQMGEDQDNESDADGELLEEICQRLGVEEAVTRGATEVIKSETDLGRPKWEEEVNTWSSILGRRAGGRKT